MKKLLATCFGTTKKAILSSVCTAAAVAVIGGGAAYASTTTSNVTAPSSVIGEELAQNYAFADAGIDSAAVQNLSTKYDEEDGQFFYDVEFTADDTEYEYWVNASDGTIIRKSADITTLNGSGSDTETITGEAETVSAAATDITMEDAKEIALSDAGVSSTDATFTKAQKDIDDQTAVFDIEFYTTTTEYDYEIRVSDGAILDKSTEQHQTASASTDSSAGTGTSGSSGNSSGSASSGTSANASSGSTSGTSSGSTSGITLDKAKEIALSDAGVSSANATFTKAKQDRDDGVNVYDIEFYTTSAEYEYEIRVSDGAILDKSIEQHQSASNSTGSSSGSSSSSNSGSSSSSGSSGNSSSGSSSSSGISVDEAKQIALNRAGLSASEVTFTKAMKEKDDGITVYEIEFYKGATEYECTINASTGAILEYDVDVDD